MQIVGGLAVLLALGALCSVLLQGYPATVKTVSLMLYRHARRAQAVQDNAVAKLNEQWMRELDRNG
jgi:hypothetical protein